MNVRKLGPHQLGNSDKMTWGELCKLPEPERGTKLLEAASCAGYDGEAVFHAFAEGLIELWKKFNEPAVQRIGYSGGKWEDLQNQKTSQYKSVSLGLLYEPARKQYLQVSGEDRWIPVNDVQAKRFLQLEKKLSAQADEGEISEVAKALHEAVTHANIEHSGPVAGYPVGVYWIEDGGRLLVTSGPKLIEPKEGKWTLIERLLTEQLGEEQLGYFLCWLKTAVESLYFRKFTPGQALTFGGPAACGKTFVQENIITPLLGGRDSKPYQFMAGKTDFNADLFYGEHQIISDETAHKDIAARQSFGTSIKDITSNPRQRFHAKHRTAFMLSPFWRLTISVNDEPENLMILPPLEPSILDKLMLFKVEMPSCLPQRDSEREMFLKQIESELPCLLNDLFRIKIPAHMQSGRFGVSHYHNPELVQAINQLSPEAQLLGLIDRCLFVSPLKSEWEGSASQLYVELAKPDSPVRQEATKLLYSDQSCGRYLQRLTRMRGEENSDPRVNVRKVGGKSIYTICPE